MLGSFFHQFPVESLRNKYLSCKTAFSVAFWGLAHLLLPRKGALFSCGASRLFLDGWVRANSESTLSGERLSLRLFSERNQQQADSECDGGQCHGNANGLEVADSGSHQERDAGSGETAE